MDTFCISVTYSCAVYETVCCFASPVCRSVCLSLCDFFCITCHFWRISIRKMVILVSYAEYWCFVRCARYRHLKCSNNDIRPTSINQPLAKTFDFCLAVQSPLLLWTETSCRGKVWRQFSTTSPTVAETSARYDQNNLFSDMVTTDNRAIFVKKFMWMTLVAFWLAAMITFIALFTYTWTCVYSNAYCVGALLWKINTHIHVRTKVNFAFL